ncbi:hypothetical protein GW17_00045487 [Ensete ventricosum]|nr:hypothetical protein GW17_00045487 [Ensete ventricosum]
MGTPPHLRSLLLAVLLMIGSTSAATQTETLVTVVGATECLDCAQKSIKTEDAVKAATELDSNGDFNVKLPSELLQDNGELKHECFAQIHSKSDAPCPDKNGLNPSKLLLKSKEGGKHTFVAVPGKLSFSSVTCASATFWPGHPLPLHRKLHKHHLPTYKSPSPVHKLPPKPEYHLHPNPVYKPQLTNLHPQATDHRRRSTSHHQGNTTNRPRTTSRRREDTITHPLHRSTSRRRCHTTSVQRFLSLSTMNNRRRRTRSSRWYIIYIYHRFKRLMLCVIMVDLRMRVKPMVEGGLCYFFLAFLLSCCCCSACKSMRFQLFHV